MSAINARATVAVAALLPGRTPRPLPDHPDAALTVDEASILCGLSPRTLESLRQKGNGPKFFKIGQRTVRYRRADLMEWIGAPRLSTAEGAANG